MFNVLMYYKTIKNNNNNNFDYTYITLLFTFYLDKVTAENLNDKPQQIIYTPSSPFNVTSIISPTVDNSTLGWFENYNSKFGLKCKREKVFLKFTDLFTDLLKKINRTTLNTWCELKNICERTEILENIWQSIKMYFIIMKHHYQAVALNQKFLLIYH